MANPALTDEQVKKLEYAFQSYPEDWGVSERLPLYSSMEGVKKQIEECEYRTALVFYATAEKEGEGYLQLKINRMEVTDPSEFTVEEAESVFERLHGLPFSDWLVRGKHCDTIQIVRKN